mgnify:CR=1 FL=1
MIVGEVLVKFEGLNVGGSIKTRTAYNMIMDAREKGIINESYNGQISALGVSTLMIGLKATLAVYYQDEVRKKLLEVIVMMINKKNNTTFADSEEFVREVMKKDETEWKSDVINCSVALKQVIRTYKLG